MAKNKTRHGLRNSDAIWLEHVMDCAIVMLKIEHVMDCAIVMLKIEHVMDCTIMYATTFSRSVVMDCTMRMYLHSHSLVKHVIEIQNQ